MAGIEVRTEGGGGCVRRADQTRRRDGEPPTDWSRGTCLGLLLVRILLGWYAVNSSANFVLGGSMLGEWMAKSGAWQGAVRPFTEEGARKRSM